MDCHVAFGTCVQQLNSLPCAMSDGGVVMQDLSGESDLCAELSCGASCAELFGAANASPASSPSALSSIAAASTAASVARTDGTTAHRDADGAAPVRSEAPGSEAEESERRAEPAESDEPAIEVVATDPSGAAQLAPGVLLVLAAKLF